MAKRKNKILRQTDVQRQILREIDSLSLSRAKVKIKPLRRRCGCGRRVIGHHKYCKKCWELHRARIQNKIDSIEAFPQQ